MFIFKLIKEILLDGLVEVGLKKLGETLEGGGKLTATGVIEIFGLSFIKSLADFSSCGDILFTGS